jgi:hypothetical protein
MSGWLDGRSLFKKRKIEKGSWKNSIWHKFFMRIEIVNRKTSKQINKLNLFLHKV